MSDTTQDSFNFTFTFEQAKEICYHLRKNNIVFSNDLNFFYTEIQKFVYNSMTIDEVEEFFDED